MDGLRIERLAGEALGRRLGELAALRIEVFRDYPYLYEGSVDYEERYLATYVRSPHSLVVAVLDGDRLVGASTALPLVEAHDEMIEPFRRQGFDPADFFYFGESVLKPAYRGRGLGVAFFAEREAEARRQGFPQATFCAVVRPADDPRRPPGYRPLDAFWRKRGFAPAPGLVADFAWRDIGEERETAKPMQFWTKRLAP